MTTAAVTESVYLIGDAGNPELPPENADALVDPVLVDLAADVAASVAPFGADQTAVIYLGDNVYPKGLYPEGHREREHGLRVLEAQVAAIGPAKGYFAAGNHDWDREGPSGWDHIVEQREFFEKGTAFLRPLTLQQVASEIEMHESTVSRVTTAKYVQTPRGVFELKVFFSSSLSTQDGSEISAKSAKDKIRGIIEAENTLNPLSDQKIADILRADGLNIARRTVTKYREQLNILPARMRKEY